ncbi:FHA domain-containing predicted membrane protein [Lachnospiraceae bacterium KM106-2]|nr:FHA domain-containing predicted membrane protein [Lachnospiraceae bacterium KM106-2]
MEAQIIRTMDDNYVIIPDESNDILNHFSTKMIQNNELDCLLKLDVRIINGVGYYYYDIGNREALTERYDRKKMTYEELIHLFSEIQALLMKAREYLLGADHFILDPRYIFEGENKISFIYVEAVSKELRIQMRELLIYLMEKVDYCNKKAVTLTYELFQIVNQDTCTLEYFFHSLSKEINRNIDDIEPAIIADMDESKVVVEPNMVQAGKVKEQPLEKNKKTQSVGALSIMMVIISLLLSGAVIYTLYYYGLLNNKIGDKLDYTKLAIVLAVFILINYLVIQKSLMKKSNKEEIIAQSTVPNTCNRVVKEKEEHTTALVETSHSEPTTVLEEEGKYLLQAVEKESYNDLFVYCYPYTLGKSAKMADGIINNSNVSRIHAKIERIEGDMMLCDMNSTNGTYINNQRIPKGTKAKLKVGDEIRLADVEYLLVRSS